MTRKKCLSSVLAVCAVVLTAALFASGPAFAADQKFKAAMVTDAAGLGDQSFNDTAWAGLKRLEEEFGTQISVVESTEMTQYVTNLLRLADLDYDMIVAVGSLLEDAIEDVADRRPNTNFLMIDSVAQGDSVLSVLYREQEGSFLAGVAAGLMTKGNRVGFIGGMDVPPVERWRVGFEAGVKTVNPDCTVVVTFIEDFNDPNKGKQLALTQYNFGIDIIFAVGGQSGLGVIHAAEEKGEGFYVIGSDSDQNHLAPKNVLASVVKAVDMSIYEAFAILRENGRFSGEVLSHGLPEGGMALATTGDLLPEEVLAEVEYWQERVLNGEVVVPSNLNELKSFAAPSK
ncbi:MAG TPA: BMP family ABC transporter substrate-binding protein [Firmicutes bacterium]|nr:BMP family ABC transporter substrate-binding protein [Bacillota bacterium]